MSSPGSVLLYAKLESILASEINDGTLAVGEQLPTEDELIHRFDVSRITVRRAIQNLVARGLVEIRRGKGTFVASPKITQELTELTGFVEDMKALGRNPSARLLEKTVVAADKMVAGHLSLAKGERVVRILRIRLADDVPVSFDETYLPLDIGKRIITNNLKVEPIFSLLEKKYNIPLIEADYKLEAIAADSGVARALRVKLGSPVFRIERTSYTEGARPVDFERLHYRGDLIQVIGPAEGRRVIARGLCVWQVGRQSTSDRSLQERVRRGKRGRAGRTRSREAQIARGPRPRSSV
jgi:GntR family transcriptional regulator